MPDTARSSTTPSRRRPQLPNRRTTMAKAALLEAPQTPAPMPAGWSEADIAVRDAAIRRQREHFETFAASPAAERERQQIKKREERDQIEADVTALRKAQLDRLAPLIAAKAAKDEAEFARQALESLRTRRAALDEERQAVERA